MIIGLTGRIAAGKGEIADYFKNKGFDYFTLSIVIREEAARRNLPITRTTLQNLGNELREQESVGVWAKKISENFIYGKNILLMV